MKKNYMVASVQVPDMPLVPGTVAARKAVLKHEIDENELMDRYYRWERERSKIIGQDAADYRVFIGKLAELFLGVEKKENHAFSPLSIFHALAAMADLTEGNTQGEILSAMGFSDVADVRSAMNLQYRGNLAYGGSELKPSGMLWFDESVALDINKLQEMAKSIFIGASQGCMIDRDYQDAIASWLRNATGSIMAPENFDLEIDGKTKLILLTTLFFHDKWEDEFEKRNTKTDVFHAPERDVDVQYLQQSKCTGVWMTDLFTALPLRFEGVNTMWFVLPGEGVTIEQLVHEGFFTAYPPDWKQFDFRDVHMELPKFDISVNYDLLESLRSMGISQVFSDESLTPYTLIGKRCIKVDQVRHSTRIKIDERGCKASSYTMMRGIAVAGSSPKPPKMDFIVNRPFLFLVTGHGNLPLFIGAIQNPAITK